MLDAASLPETQKPKQPVLLLWRGLRLEVGQLLFSHVPSPGGVGRPYQPALDSFAEITKGDRISTAADPEVNLRIASKAEAQALREALHLAAEVTLRRQHFQSYGHLPPNSPPPFVEIVAEPRTWGLRWLGPSYLVRARAVPAPHAL